VLNYKIEDALLKSLARGPERKANKWPMYMINGYKFNTKDHGQGMSTTNSGVCVQGGDTEKNDYYGILTDIVEVHYTGFPRKMLVLFKCDWFDPTPNHGTKIDNYGIVEVRASRRYNNYDPFIFAQQAKQVYYTQYPEGQHDWLVVIKTKARGTIQSLEITEPEKNTPYQDESITQLDVSIASDDLQQSLVDVVGPMDEAYAHLLNQFDTEEGEEAEEDEEAEFD